MVWLFVPRLSLFGVVVVSLAASLIIAEQFAAGALIMAAGGLFEVIGRNVAELETR